MGLHQSVNITMTGRAVVGNKAADAFLAGACCCPCEATCGVEVHCPGRRDGVARVNWPSAGRNLVVGLAGHDRVLPAGPWSQAQLRCQASDGSPLLHSPPPSQGGERPAAEVGPRLSPPTLPPSSRALSLPPLPSSGSSLPPSPLGMFFSVCACFQPSESPERA